MPNRQLILSRWSQPRGCGVGAHSPCNSLACRLVQCTVVHEQHALFALAAVVCARRPPIRARVTVGPRSRPLRRVQAVVVTAGRPFVEQFDDAAFVTTLRRSARRAETRESKQHQVEQHECVGRPQMPVLDRQRVRHDRVDADGGDRGAHHAQLVDPWISIEPRRATIEDARIPAHEVFDRQVIFLLLLLVLFAHQQSRRLVAVPRGAVWTGIGAAGRWGRQRTTRRC